jgi:arylsulfatase A-like enzyme
MRPLPTRTLLTLPPSLLAVAGLTGFKEIPPSKPQSHPNILLIMVDQMQTPPEGYGSNEGAAQGIKEVLGFRPISQGNTFTQYFQGFMRLRQNAVVMKKHYTASAASVPSRCCIMTGEYPTVTGVTQTDGLFKSAQSVPFLDTAGTPTIGDWFRAAGYSTHYFGKWHVSDPTPPRYLEPWGFSNWECSYPEPHGGSAKNLGAYRDVVFADYAVDFLNAQGTTPSATPWLMVASFVNPHDVSGWPIQWMVPDTSGVVPYTNYPPVPEIPAPGEKSLWGTVINVINGDSVKKTFQVDLNPDAFPQGCASLPPTFYESLDTKPRCQEDFAYKWGLAWGSKLDYAFIMQNQPYRTPHPFQLQDSYYYGWSLSYIQFYNYLHYLVDLQIRRVLAALDANHLTENTIVVFMADHGDNTTAHGGIIQKWYNAYEESTRVPMIVSSPLVNPDKNTMREINGTTSSIDLAPTLLGLAGYTQGQLIETLEAQHGTNGVKPFPGVNLAPYITGSSAEPILGNDGNPRPGVLFMTSDMITEKTDSTYENQYELFLHRVDSTINLGYAIDHGTVCQPNNPRAFCTGDWKIVQYVDPNGVKSDEWELYCLKNDPIELYNLDDYATGQVRADASVPGMTHEELVLKNDSLKNQLNTVLGITEKNANAGGVMLLQNNPNPFTGKTNITFLLPQTLPVRLSVTDLSGREVKLLQDKTLSRGVHTVTFDGQNTAPGVYFIVLKAGSEQLARKMIVTQ